MRCWSPEGHVAVASTTTERHAFCEWMAVPPSRGNLRLLPHSVPSRAAACETDRLHWIGVILQMWKQTPPEIIWYLKVPWLAGGRARHDTAS